MKKFFMTLMIVTVSMELAAQDINSDKYYFTTYEDIESSEVDTELMKKHPLGDQIAKMMYLLRQEYTWMEAKSATNPSTKVWIEKPAIYNSVKKVERYYKKAVKEGDITLEQAQSEFGQILEIAISIRNHQTDELESTLNKLKEDKEILELYTDKVVLVTN